MGAVGTGESCCVQKSVYAPVDDRAVRKTGMCKAHGAIGSAVPKMEGREQTSVECP